MNKFKLVWRAGLLSLVIGGFGCAHSESHRGGMMGKEGGGMMGKDGGCCPMCSEMMAGGKMMEMKMDKKETADATKPGEHDHSAAGADKAVKPAMGCCTDMCPMMKEHKADAKGDAKPDAKADPHAEHHPDQKPDAK